MTSALSRLGEPQPINPTATGNYFESVSKTLGKSADRLQRAYQTHAAVRKALGLPLWDAPLDVAAAMSPPPGYVSQSDVGDIVDTWYACKLAKDYVDQALSNKRKVAFDADKDDFMIEGLPTDPATIDVSTGKVVLRANDGQITHGDISKLGNPLVIAALPALTRIAIALATCFSVSKIADALSGTSAEKTNQTILEAQKKVLETGGTPDDAAKVAQAYDEAAKKSHESAAKADEKGPIGQIASTANTFLYILLAGVLAYGAVKIIGALPERRQQKSLPA